MRDMRPANRRRRSGGEKGALALEFGNGGEMFGAHRQTVAGLLRRIHIENVKLPTVQRGRFRGGLRPISHGYRPSFFAMMSSQRKCESAPSAAPSSAARRRSKLAARTAAWPGESSAIGSHAFICLIERRVSTWVKGFIAPLRLGG